ncbi:hypothetical protein [Joostella sp. CR20]|uniref:hypothetical protein n=1 Tax=Joostella sp. CR20 TaxID=2804312 RepID=UPI00313D4F9C
MPKKDFNTLPPETEIEVIAIKGKKTVKKIMQYSKALTMDRAKGWEYIFYQKNFSQFKKWKNTKF